MRSPLIDLVLLALLVLFFGIQQRNRPESFFRIWLTGWLFVLASVAVWEWQGIHPYHASLFECLRLDSLVIGSVCFSFSFVSMRRHDPRIVRFGILISVWAALAIDMATLGYIRPAALLVPIVCGNVSGLFTIISLIPANERKLRLGLLVACTLFGAMTAFAVLRGHAGALTGLVLAEIFLCAGLLFATLPGKDRFGRFLGTVGFVSWSLGYLLAALPQSAKVMPFAYEVWNIPKHLVGFGMILILFGTSRDESRDLSEKYRSLYDEFRVLFDNNPHPMWIYQPGSGEFLAVNEAALHQYGYTREEFLTMNILDIRPVEEQARVMEAMRHPKDLLRQSWQHQRKDGSTFDVDVTAHHISYQGKPARFVLAIDISDREELHRQLTYKAQHDMLTDLPNRSVIEERIPQALARAASDNTKVALLTIDVDRFKQINDTLGHIAGDECLKEIARRLRSRIRQCDTIARTGGEEFTALIGGLGEARYAERISESLLELFATPFATSEHEVRITISIGVAIYPDDGETAQILRKRSDQALYYAKRNGGNQTVFASEEVYAPIELARTVEASLRRAIRSNDFFLVYHPIFSRDKTLSYFEVLLRSKDPALASVGPAVFVPIAEECGLIPAMGRWALEEACRQLQQWTDDALDVRPLAVNVSAKQLARNEFLSEVKTTLEKHKIASGLLNMELTETTVMENQDSVTEIMKSLSALGVEFAIDDFGTGYSSLARLADLPLASLKIDRSFVDRVGSEGARTIILAVVQIAKNLHLKVVAEGVETAEQFEILCECGCDLFQGYYFSKPLPAEAATELLKDAPPMALQVPARAETSATVV